MEVDRSHEYVGEVHSHRGKWIVLLLVMLAVGAGMYWLRETNTDRTLVGNTAKLQPLNGEPGTQGTSGAGQPAATAADSAELAQIQEITAADDPARLIGRHVSLQLPVAERANDVAFWVGPLDRRVLVALRRDHRDSGQRNEGTEAGHGIGELRPGQQISIEGSVQPVPKAEDMYSWELTSREVKELVERGVYIRADSVQ
jgi:hypothetical protein